MDQYYKDPENYFEIDSKRNTSIPADPSSQQSLFTTTLTKESKSSIEGSASLSSPSLAVSLMLQTLFCLLVRVH